ncbi:MAG TPA: ATP-binding protein [Paracoccaceae bacterium]
MTGRGGVFVFVLAALLAAGLAYALAARLGVAALETRLDRSLILTARAVETEIARFRALPDVAGEDARIRAAVRGPGNPGAIATANAYLETIAAHSGAAQLYLLDAAGLTIASSNWNSPGSFIGQDYSFRPYFLDARRDGRGRFYAIGVTTGQPGYFLSTLIAEGAASGVLVVKVDLSPLQATWASAQLATAIADADGVVFLSGEPGWLYRPLEPLSPATLARLVRSRTYDGVGLADAAPLLAGGAAAMEMTDTAGHRMRARSARIEAEDWRLVAAAPIAPVVSAALAWALGAALLALLATGLAKLLHQRRQIVQLRLRQNSLLERRVEERTRELAREVQARRQTEVELRAAQDGLIHSEKMAALGRMSAAIVHEISQPLAAMEATLAAAEISLPASETRTDNRIGSRIATARNLIRRMQRTTKHLKSFSRKEQGELAPIDLGQVVENALELVAPRAKAVGVVPQVAGAGPLLVRAGAVRMEQVCVNLLLNALDAVEGRAGGAITVSLGKAPGRVQLCVADNGAGIAPDDLARVAEPFFSTKVSGEGLGLGLSISQAIVGEFGGRIDIASTLGEGTEVIVSLPAIALNEAAE